MTRCNIPTPRTAAKRGRTAAPHGPLCALVPFVTAAFFSPAFANPAADGRVLLSRGDLAGARAALEAAHVQSPRDFETTLLWARTLENADGALKEYETISRDITAPDSVRAEAYFLLGCASYLRGGPHRASAYFGSAAGLSSDGRYAEPRYLGGVGDNADTAVPAELEKTARDTISSAGATARYYLGLYHYARKDYAKALDCFSSAAAYSDSSSWSCAAGAGAYACASLLSKSEEASAILARIKRVWGEYLEGPMLARVKQTARAAKKDSIAVRDTAARPLSDSSAKIGTPAEKTSAKAPSFSLQVGAFSALANAHNLKVKLAARFPSVSIAQGNADGKTLFRVRVGSFGSQETARTFGDSVLAKKGIAFTVVEE
jgi:cell division septation protein DedD